MHQRRSRPKKAGFQIGNCHIPMTPMPGRCAHLVHNLHDPGAHNLNCHKESGQWGGFLGNARENIWILMWCKDLRGEFWKQDGFQNSNARFWCGLGFRFVHICFFLCRGTTIYQISKERIKQIERGIGSLRSHHLVVQKLLLLKMSGWFPTS